MMHPVIQRLLDYPEELSTQEVAVVLDIDRSKVVLIIEKPDSLLEARSHNSGNGRKKRYRITREALLRYLVASTTGSKAVLLESIEKAFPNSSALKPVPAGVIDARTHFRSTPAAAAHARKPKGDTTHPDQMDLFASAKA